MTLIVGDLTPSAEMQSVHSRIPANWAEYHPWLATDDRVQHVQSYVVRRKKKL